MTLAEIRLGQPDIITYLFERLPDTSRWLVVAADGSRYQVYSAHTLLLSRPNGYP